VGESLHGGMIPGPTGAPLAGGMGLGLPVVRSGAARILPKRKIGGRLKPSTSSAAPAARTHAWRRGAQKPARIG